MFLNSKSPGEQAAFADRCGTSVGYLRKAICIGQRLSEALAIAIEKESGGAVTVEELRPDLIEHWKYIRGTAKREAQALPREAA